VLGRYLEDKLGRDLNEVKISFPNIGQSICNSEHKSQQTPSDRSGARNKQANGTMLSSPPLEGEVRFARQPQAVVTLSSVTTKLNFPISNPEIVIVDYGEEEEII